MQSYAIRNRYQAQAFSTEGERLWKD